MCEDLKKRLEGKQDLLNALEVIIDFVKRKNLKPCDKICFITDVDENLTGDCGILLETTGEDSYTIWNKRTKNINYCVSSIVVDKY